MTIRFYEKGKLIKTWHNVNPALHFIPQNGDDVLLHFGNYNEEECLYTVCSRTISGTNMDVLKINVAQLYVEESNKEEEHKELWQNQMLDRY